MAKYRDHLPQLASNFFLTDGGIETTLIFHEGLELPDFAAFDLLKDEAGSEALRNYFRTYAAWIRTNPQLPTPASSQAVACAFAIQDASILSAARIEN